MTFYFDAETFSEADLKKVGVYRYAEHPSTVVILATYADGNGPVNVWSPSEGQVIPHDLLVALLHRDDITAHNSNFDRNVVSRALHRMGILASHERDQLLDSTRWSCTMAKALAHGLPGDLDGLGEALGLPASQAKIKEGKTLINRFCKPTPANHKRRRYDHETHPELWTKFVQYAVHDIIAMRECDRQIPIWNMGPRERALWLLDQKINDRGFYCDVELVDAAVLATEEEKRIMAHRFVQLTNGEVMRPTMRDQFKHFMASRYCLALENTQAETLRRVRERYQDGSEVAEIIDIALASNKTSTSKYARIQPAIGPDRRFRGGLQFAGAGRTRRWSGRTFQPHNLPSRGLPPAQMVDAYICAVKAHTHTYIFDNLMLYGSAALRGVVTAPKGRHIVAADLSNIEGRILAWVAGESWKLDAFRNYDNGTGPDLYNITANMIVGVDPWHVPKKIRNVFGKVPDLASGYQGGVAGYQQFAKAYGVRMADHWDTIKSSISPAIILKAQRNLEKSWGQAQLAALEISELEWVASEACKLAWRSRHPATVSFWYALQDAAINAVKYPGSVHEVTCLKLSCREYQGHMWLQILLPSGNRLCYFQPHVGKTVTVNEDTGEETTREYLTYWSLASEEGGPRVWQKTFTHGGKLTGNVCVTGDTKVLTDRGLISIAEVTRDDKVWDGVEWVATNGPVCNGAEEVGEWMGIRTTQDHQILAGSSWRRAIDMDTRSSAEALVLAHDSAPSWFSRPASVTTALRFVAAIVEAKLRYRLAPFFADKPLGAALADISQPGRSGFVALNSPRRSCGLFGASAIKRWLPGVLSQPTPRIATMGAEASTCVLSGSKTGPHFLSMDSLFLGGTISPSTWTEPTTISGMSLETSALCPGRSTPATAETTGSSSSKGSNSPWQSFGNAIYRIGEALTRSGITWRKAGALTGLWRSTTKAESVFDLMDCGPRNRFTVMTDAGFAVIHNCQTLARDILAYNMPGIEAAGYDVVLTVHDEVVAEAPVELDEAEMVRILASNPPWATCLPLAAAGFCAPRYKKED